MKLTKICMAVAVSAACLLTSCLGEGNTTNTLTAPGVVSMAKDGKTVIKTWYGVLYAPEFIKETDNCVWVAFTHDSNDPLNANAEENGYMYVTSPQTAPIQDYYASPYPSDTAKLMAKEIPLKFASASFGVDYFAYIDNYIFLTSGFEGMDKQINDWMLALDVNQKPEVDNNGNNIYTLFLRAIKLSDGQTPSGNYALMNAYNMSNSITQLEAIEKAAGKSKYCLKFGFINEIKNDSTFTWDYSGLIEFPVPTDSNQ